MFPYLTRFQKQEDGAVTVDWVVLTAAVAGFCIVYVFELKDASDALAEDTEAAILLYDPNEVVGQNIQDLPTSQ